jgi:uncharacterized phage-associated protein
MRLGYNNIMLINNDRKKLIAAIVYYAKYTNSCSKTKLFKLLYFLDFEHFKQTGRSVTGLEYYAWKFGPVPTSLYDEFDLPEPDFLEHIKLEPIVYCGYNTLNIKPLSEPDVSHFSKREMALIKSLAEQYKNVSATDIVEKTHLPNLPWHKVFKEENKPQSLIPYEYAIDTAKEEHILELAKESKEMKDAYR